MSSPWSKAFSAAGLDSVSSSLSDVVNQAQSAVTGLSDSLDHAVGLAPASDASPRARGSEEEDVGGEGECACVRACVCARVCVSAPPVCACVRACVRECVRAARGCVRARVDAYGGGAECLGSRAATLDCRSLNKK